VKLGRIVFAHSSGDTALSVLGIALLNASFGQDEDASILSR
jgi:hypothetical protein